MQCTYTKPDPEATHCWHITEDELEHLILKHIVEHYGAVPQGNLHIFFPDLHGSPEPNTITVRIQSTDTIRRKTDET